jgi:hypothetical protein
MVVHRRNFKAMRQFSITGFTSSSSGTDLHHHRVLVRSVNAAHDPSANPDNRQSVNRNGRSVRKSHLVIVPNLLPRRPALVNFFVSSPLARQNFALPKRLGVESKSETKRRNEFITILLK